MGRYLILYRAVAPGAGNVEPDQPVVDRQAWRDWFGRNDTVVYDGGSPLTGDDATITGYSILQADSRQALDRVLADHPHRGIGSFEVLECRPIPDPF